MSDKALDGGALPVVAPKPIDIAVRLRKTQLSPAFVTDSLARSRRATRSISISSLRWIFRVMVPSRIDPCGYTSPSSGESSQYWTRAAPMAW